MAAAAVIAGCSDEYLPGPDNGGDGSDVIKLAGEINQSSVTRVNDDGFADGDVMGVYIVDYNGNDPGTLLSSGNRGDNVRHTFNEAAYRWDSAYDLFWKDKHTRIDVYGYYPIGKPENVNAYSFTVQSDQSKLYDDGTMGNYESSDFLWGKVGGVEPTANVIRLPLSHRMKVSAKANGRQRRNRCSLQTLFKIQSSTSPRAPSPHPENPGRPLSPLKQATNGGLSLCRRL